MQNVKAKARPAMTLVSSRPEEWRRGNFLITTDPEAIDFDVVHGFLTTCYWSPGIPRATVERAARHSQVFGLYEEDQETGARTQVGYARVISDQVSIAWLADVFVLASHRGLGLARWLMEIILAFPDFREVRRWMLRTRDAHGLYGKVGYEPMSDPDRFMVRAEHPGYL